MDEYPFSIKLVSEQRFITFKRKRMEEHLGEMFKLTGSNYSVWKSKMRDMLVCKDLWLAMEYDKTKLDKIDAPTWEVLHLKEATYRRCSIDMNHTTTSKRRQKRMSSGRRST